MSRPEQKTAVNIVMGAGTFGEAGIEGSRVDDLRDVEAILDVFQKHGHYEVDCARSYVNGTSEEYLAKVNWQERGLAVSTKINPKVGKVAWSGPDAPERISHNPC
ncbi:hypothetical protein C8Q73DRAFT_267010 [Cubamyces lactineus]|nr:hypothetical protein C8Q73DRAFT_267010 [Cubamyces lactineus]